MLNKGIYQWTIYMFARPWANASLPPPISDITDGPNQLDRGTRGSLPRIFLWIKSFKTHFYAIKNMKTYVDEHFKVITPIIHPIDS